MPSFSSYDTNTEPFGCDEFSWVSLERDLHFHVFVQEKDLPALGRKVRILFLEVITDAMRLDGVIVQNRPDG